ncbi:C-C motif chemokine 17 [Esox lucius]|uniref:Chemokine interleukin-8-like domain-containing protein n=1 Tax=Esox lucius TaxID=8010 RepID=A0A3P8XKS6_ESOLU|nr:C-C motif chemokine 17 [Esox lucius]
MLALISLLLLFINTLLISSTSAQASGPAPACCTEIKGTIVPIKLLKRYYLQNTALCNIKAVTFVTMKDIRICSDLSNNWAKKAMKHLDRKKRETLKNIDITSTTTTTTDPLCIHSHKTTHNKMSAHNPKTSNVHKHRRIET